VGPKSGLDAMTKRSYVITHARNGGSKLLNDDVSDDMAMYH